MKINKYYVELRSDLLEVITGVNDSNGSLFWDNTTPNWLTKNKLNGLYAKYFNLASTHYGLYKVTRHTMCSNNNHDNVDGGYPMTNEYNLTIKYGDINFEWTGYQSYQGEFKCTCPCDINNTESIHWIIDDIIFDKRKVFSFDRNELIKILDCILDAIRNAGDKCPRSSIRESLLKSVLMINDQLLPLPMNVFISKYIE